MNSSVQLTILGPGAPQGFFGGLVPAIIQSSKQRTAIKHKKSTAIKTTKVPQSNNRNTAIKHRKELARLASRQFCDGFPIVFLLFSYGFRLLSFGSLMVSYGFPLNFRCFCDDFLMCLLWFSGVFLIVFPWFSIWFSDGFPMLCLCLSDGFPTVL